MNRKIKLIWAFKGIETLETAKRHCEDLEAFAKSKTLHFYEVGVREINEFFTETFIVVDEVDMKIYRDALKPQRAELA